MSESLPIQMTIVAQDFTVVKTYFAPVSTMNSFMKVGLLRRDE